MSTPPQKQKDNLFIHQDVLSAISHEGNLGDKLECIHQAMRTQFPFIHRISVAMYDPKTDMLKTFIHSSGGAEPLTNYQTKLADSSSLMEILEKGLPRVVNDISIFRHGRREHTKRVAREGYASSYTMPMYSNDQFFGFLFINSYDSAPFSESVLQCIDPYGHLIILTVINDLSVLQNLIAAVKTARDFSHARDGETGEHQDRMSRFARLIARRIADKFELSDEYIENLFIYSPLHDIGKMTIPDHILLKEGKLTEEEFRIMQTHAKNGLELVNHMLENFDVSDIHHIDMLRNIASLHHEAIDGSGYPEGLMGSDIPIEARIVAAADVFDALTSKRPYKHAWTNDEAFDTLKKLASIKLDRDCVNALVNSRKEVEQIQQQFLEDTVD